MIVYTSNQRSWKDSHSTPICFGRAGNSEQDCRRLPLLRVAILDTGGLPKPALGENGTSFPLAIFSQMKDQLPDESCMISAAQTSLVSGDPPIINNLVLFGSVTPRYNMWTAVGTGCSEGNQTPAVQLDQFYFGVKYFGRG